eukprot:106643-Rhodomonas_salina.1
MQPRFWYKQDQWHAQPLNCIPPVAQCELILMMRSDPMMIIVFARFDFRTVLSSNQSQTLADRHPVLISTRYTSRIMAMVTLVPSLYIFKLEHPRDHLRPNDPISTRPTN